MKTTVLTNLFSRAGHEAATGLGVFLAQTACPDGPVVHQGRIDIQVPGEATRSTEVHLVRPDGAAFEETTAEHLVDCMSSGQASIASYNNGHGPLLFVRVAVLEGAPLAPC